MPNVLGVVSKISLSHVMCQVEQVLTLVLLVGIVSSSSSLLLGSASLENQLSAAMLTDPRRVHTHSIAETWTVPLLSPFFPPTRKVQILLFHVCSKTLLTCLKNTLLVNL